MVMVISWCCSVSGLKAVKFVFEKKKCLQIKMAQYLKITWTSGLNKGNIEKVLQNSKRTYTCISIYSE